MADVRVRIRINGTSEAGTGTDYTAYIYKCKTTDILNHPSEFDITLLGSTNTTNIAKGKIVELYWGTTISTANRFFKGKIKTVEEQTATKIRIVGKGAGWADLMDRKHAFREEWGSASRKAPATIDRTTLVDYLRSRDLDSVSYILAKGTIVSGTSLVSFFDTQYENRLNMFIRCAELWDTDLWFNQDGSGNDQINLTAKGSDKTGTALFYFSGTSKNAKVGSNILDEENQFTQVNVIGAGDGLGQVSGKWPTSGYDPATPEKEMVVPRPDLKNSTDCTTVATTIHGRVSQPIRRIRFAPDVPGDWITTLATGDTIRIASSNLANLTAPFDTKIHEISFEIDYETGTFEYILQTENRLTRPFDKQSNTDNIANQSNSTGQFENTMLNLLQDANTITRASQWQGGIIAKKMWLSLGGTTDPASMAFEDSYNFILDDDGATLFRGNLLFRGVSADPAVDPYTFEGALYYNSTSHLFRFFNGTAWTDLSGGGGGGTEWTRVAGAPSYLYPTTANDHVRPNGTADLGGASSRWNALYVNYLYAYDNVVLGSSSGDTITCQGHFGSHLIPNLTGNWDLGSSSYRWRTIYATQGSIIGDLETHDVYPTADSTYDIGTTSVRYENGYFNNVDSDYIVANNQIALGPSAYVGSSWIPLVDAFYNLGQGAYRWNNLYLAGNLYLDGSATLGNASTDTITVNGRFINSLIPNGAGYNLGQLASPTWLNLYLSGGVTALTASSFAAATFSGTLTANGAFVANGNMTFGNASSDTITVGGRFSSSLIPSATGYNLGFNGSPTWNHLYLLGGVNCITTSTMGAINCGALSCSTFATSSITLVTNLNADRLDSRHVTNGTTGVLAADQNNLNISNTWQLEPQSAANTATLGSSGYRWNTIYCKTLDASVSIVKPGGVFRIDHPLDPKNKTLEHSFVEAPERMTIYKGRGKLSEGRAIIKMPEYFHALNSDEEIEYSLTPIGHPAALFISKEMEKGVFEVGGDVDCAFSWIVYAVRHDAWALANPLVVEADKPAEDKGAYRNPEAHEHIDPGCTKRQQDKNDEKKVKMNGQED